MPPDTNQSPDLTTAPTLVGELPPANPKPPPKPPRRPRLGHWSDLNQRARTIAAIASLFVALVAAGLIGGYFYAQTKRPATATTTSPKVETLSPSDLAKLGQIGSNLGSSGQVLNVSADALFRGQADVVGNLTVGGHFAVSGPVTLSQLDITGATATQTLTVSGATTLQNSLTVAGLANLASLTVTGAVNLGSLTASAITVRSITITGPLTIGHLITQGPAPVIAAGPVGAGGTVSISGNDTAGQVNINTGSGPSADATLATVTFKAAYGATVHIALTPLTQYAAAAEAYVTPSATGFTVHAVTPAAGQTLSFDYLVTQ